MTSDAVTMPADLRRWLTDHLPDITAATDASWPRTQSRVWRLTTRTSTAYVKLSPSAQSYTRETSAYRHAAAALDPDRAPQLIATDPALRAILTTALAGKVVRDLPLAPEAEAKVHKLAGRVLRRWHDHLAPVPPQARDNLTAALAGQAAEATACLDSLGGHLTEHEQILVREVARDLPAMAADLPLVYLHGDFSPRNWVWNPQTQTLGLIDFEMADHALAVQDMVWLFGAVWPTRPDLRASFLTGYGGEPTTLEQRALLLLTTRLAVSYLSAGLATNDQVLIDRGHNALGALVRAHA
ncbi:aminoglycoside phosphotransferase family protein [Actinomadura sp. SCN-SB]|uniref:aminoglycoside phosphotransferase family protein n=1 Tax=Actinomadura sp. SCN-SB TaxID=3373092 RepID=UPI0037512DFE